MHPQLRPFTRQLFLDFCAIFSPEWPLILFVIMIHQVSWPSPGTLLGSSKPKKERKESMDHKNDFFSKHSLCTRVISSCLYIYASGRTDFAHKKSHAGNWSPNLQTQFCKPYPADFFGCNLLFCVFLTFMICLCLVQFKDCSRGVTKPKKQTNKQTKTNEWCPNTHTFACGQAIVTLHSVWQTSHVCTYTWSATVRDSFLGPGHAATERAVFARPLERTRVIRKK